MSIGRNRLYIIPFGFALALSLLAMACGSSGQPTQRQEQPSGQQDQAKPADQAQSQATGKGQTLEDRLASVKKLISMSSAELRKVPTDDLLQMFTGTWPCEGTPKRGGTLKRATSADFPHMDPTFVTIDGLMQHANVVYDRIVQTDASCDTFKAEKAVIAPDLAKSWEFSPDGKRLTFHLYEGVKWQNVPPVNGREFTSDDIKWTIEHLKTTDGSINKSTLEVVEKVETPDKYTAVFVLKQPAWYLMERLTGFRQLVMMPKEVKERDGDFRRAMIGTGPFILKEFRENVSITFERNPDYEKRGGWFKDKPYLDRLEVFFIKDEAQMLAAYRSGQVHYVRTGGGAFNNLGDAVALLKTRPDSHMVVEAPFAGGWRLGMRLDQKPFEDVRVRRALSMAMDRQAIIDQVYGGLGVVLPDILWPLIFDKQPKQEELGPYYQFNPPQAKKLLAEAGYGSGFTTEVTFFRYGSDIPDALAIIKEQWKELGVTLNIVEQDYALYNNLLAKADYKQMTSAWGPSSADADVYFYETYHSKSSNNRYRVSDPKADALTEKIRLEMDPVKRRTLMKEFWDLNLDQVWAIPRVAGLSFRVYDQKIRNHRGRGGGADNRANSMDHAAQIQNIWLAQ